MGPGLAQVFSTAGYEVGMYTRRQETLERAQSVTKQNLATFVENGLLKEQDVPAILDRISWTLSVEECGKDADLVIETIAEKTDAKKELYDALDAICPERTIFTSNTSYLNIYDLMPEKRLPQTVIAHWFAPPQIIPLVEVVKGPKTSQETTDLIVELLKKVDACPASWRSSCQDSA
jgi:3-hydroxybutyryl-CoA dehydrogenase